MKARELFLKHLELLKNYLRKEIPEVAHTEEEKKLGYPILKQLLSFSETYGNFNTEELESLEAVGMYRPSRLQLHFRNMFEVENYFNLVEQEGSYLEDMVLTGSLLQVTKKETGESGTLFYSVPLDICFGFGVSVEMEGEADFITLD
jgi:hypothetical protein